MVRYVLMIWNFTHSYAQHYSADAFNSVDSSTSIDDDYFMEGRVNIIAKAFASGIFF